MNSTFNYAACQTDGDDLRFFDNSNAPLSFWTEKWTNGGNSILWVKVPLAGTTSIKIAYGNATIGSGSNGAATFPLFDDFSGGSINSSKWAAEGDAYSTVTVVSGKAHIRSLCPNAIWGGTYMGLSDLTITHGGASGTKTHNMVTRTNDLLVTMKADVGTPTTNLKNNTWVLMEYSWMNTSSTIYKENESVVASHSTNVPLISLPASFGVRTVYSGPGSNYGALIRSLTTFAPGVAIRGSYWVRYDTRSVYPVLEPTIDLDWVFVRRCSVSEPSTFISDIPALPVYQIQISDFANVKAVQFYPATPVSNYIARLDLNSTFTYAVCQADGDDVRFFDNSNAPLSFWTEKWTNGGNSILWVKVPLAGTTSIKIAYGNSTIGSGSNGAATFPLFDDFSGGSINSSKWAAEGDAYSTVTVVSGKAHIRSLAPNAIWGGTYMGFSDLTITHGGASGTKTHNMVTRTNDLLVTMKADVGTPTTNLKNNTWVLMEYSWMNTSRAIYKENESVVASHSTNVPLISLPASFGVRTVYSGPGYNYGALIRSLTSFAPGYSIRGSYWVRYDTRSVYPVLEPTIDLDWVFVRMCNSIESHTWLSEVALPPPEPVISDFLHVRMVKIVPATPVSDYAVRMDLNSTFNYAACQADGDDVRFFDNTDAPLSFWTEKWTNGGNSILWVKVPLAGTTSIKIAYGNATIGSGSNGAATFPLFDDFSGGSINSSKWAAEGDAYSTVTVVSGKAHIRSLCPNAIWGVTHMGFSDLSITHGAGYGTKTHNTVMRSNEYLISDRADSATTTSNVKNQTWILMDYSWISGTSAVYRENESIVASHSTNVPLISLPAAFGVRTVYSGPGYNYGALIRSLTTFSTGYAIRGSYWFQYEMTTDYPVLEPTIDLDWVFVRKCVATESAASLASLIISVDSPANGEVFPTPSVPLDITVCGTYTDAIWYQLDGGSTTLLPSNTSIVVADGSHSITFYANDTAGAICSVTRTFVVDTAAPIVDITSPTSGATLASGSVSVIFTATDLTKDDTWYTVDGGASTIVTGSSFSLSLADGSHSIVVYCNDTFNRLSSDSITISIDSANPVLTVNTPSNGVLLGSSSVSLNVHVVDANLDKIWYRLDSGSIVLMPTNTSISVADGAHSITFFANDTLGHESQVTRTFTVDTAAPVVDITSPASGLTLASGSVNVIFTATDLTKDDTWYTVNGSGATIVTGSSFSLSLADGSYLIAVVCNDSLGRITSDSIVITIDTATPLLTVNSPLDGAMLGSNNVSLSVYAADPLLSAIWYVLDSGTYVMMPTNTSITVADGLHTITFYANDTLGHVSTVLRTFTVDTTAPVVSITSPSDGASLTSGSVNVDFTATDFTKDDTWYTVDGGAPTIVTGSSFSLSLADGSHSIAVYCNDTFNRITPDSITIMIDTVDPAITVNSPSNGALFSSSSVSLNLGVIDVHLDAIWYRLDSGSIILLPANTSITVADGVHSITFFANDTLGHESQVTRTFTVDTAAPVVDITSPASGSILSSGSVNVVFTATDLTKDDTWYTVNGGAPTIVVGSSFSLSLADGSYTVIVSCNDSLGRVSPDSITISIDTANPVLAVNSPSSGALLGSSSVSLNARVIDAHLDSIWYRLDGGSIVLMPVNTSIIIADGAHTITIYANDTLGHENQITHMFTVDTAAPVVDINSPTSGSEMSSGSLNVVFTATDLTKDDTWYTIDGGAQTLLAGNSFSLALADGVHTIAVYCNDSTGRISSDAIVITIDATKPSITYIGYSNPTIQQGDARYLSWILSDAHPATYTLWLNGLIIQSNTYSASTQVSVLIDASVIRQLNYTLVVQDTFGNVERDQKLIDVVNRTDNGIFLKVGVNHVPHGITLNLTLNMSHWAVLYLSVSVSVTTPEALNLGILPNNLVIAVPVAFNLNITNSTALRNGFVRVYYSQAAIASQVNEDALAVYRWSASSWSEPAAIIDLTENYIDIPLSKNGIYVIVSTPKQDYIPILIIVLIGITGGIVAAAGYSYSRKKAIKLKTASKSKEAQALSYSGTITSPVAPTTPGTITSPVESHDAALAKRARLMQSTAPASNARPVPAVQAGAIQRQAPVADAMKKKAGGAPEPEVDIAARAASAQEMSSEVSVERVVPRCVVHKGPISGLSYTCKHCGTVYCMKCAKHLVEAGEPCWTCTKPLSLDDAEESESTLPKITVSTFTPEVWQRIRELDLPEEIFDEVIEYVKQLPQNARLKYLEEAFKDNESFDTDF